MIATYKSSVHPLVSKNIWIILKDQRIKYQSLLQNLKERQDVEGARNMGTK
ncbi:hypothetical protein PanWU01x14_216900 [Parasponia andersonii]|uniref:Uncharacterized protein n=1 Tax=Parasponia andersonii TaxID=3476 RepID=A0A2P5BR93_PARAD|nr:hypothetical protein PanWU01x14_216900 [Parasponia andersonii]